MKNTVFIGKAQTIGLVFHISLNTELLYFADSGNSTLPGDYDDAASAIRMLDAVVHEHEDSRTQISLPVSHSINAGSTHTRINGFRRSSLRVSPRHQYLRENAAA